MKVMPSVDSSLRTRNHHLPIPQGLLDLVRTASTTTWRRTLAAVLLAWIPCFILSAIGGVSSLRWFLADFAAQTRILIVVPLLILGQPAMIARQKAIAQHFVERDLVRREDHELFRSYFATLVRLGDSKAASAVALVITYLALAAAVPNVPDEVLLPWCYDARASGTPLSLAGYWYAVVAIPIACWLLFRWLWRQLLWTTFIRHVSHLELQLIPSHPDGAGGLSFVNTCLRAYLPLSSALGIIAAGGVANRVVHHGQPLAAFQAMPLAVIAVVLIVCVTPLCLFQRPLLRAKRRGVFEYGALALSVGRQFERKWLARDCNIDQTTLEEPDFSATTDLYSVVANINHLGTVPFSLRNVAMLCLAGVAPGIPVAIGTLPFDVIVQKLFKMLL